MHEYEPRGKAAAEIDTFSNHTKLYGNHKPGGWLLVGVVCPHSILYIRFVGTHAEFDQIDAATI